MDLTHRPSGVTVHCESERSQTQNKANALAKLRAKLWEEMQARQEGALNSTRKSHVGSGMRGDKTVTIRYQDGIVTYHNLGRKISLRDFLDGKLPA